MFACRPANLLSCRAKSRHLSIFQLLVERRFMSEISRDSSTALRSARNDKAYVDLGDFGEDRCRGSLARARFAKLHRNLVEFGYHSLTRRWIIEQLSDGFGQVFWSRAMLNEFRNNFFIGEHVRHAEIFYFYEQPCGEIRRPFYFVDQHESHSAISRCQRRAP